MLHFALLLLLQATALDESAAAFAKGDAAAREHLLKSGASSILALRKVRDRSPEAIDALLFVIKAAPEGGPSAEILRTLEASQSVDFGRVTFEEALEALSHGLPLLFDPALFRSHWGKRLTLDMKERPRREILESFCRQLGLDYGFFYGVVLIAEPARLWPVAPLAFRETALTAEESDRAAALIDRLASDGFQEREEAQAALKKLGKATIPLLEKGMKGEDPERRARCAAIRQVLTAPPAPATFHRPAADRQKLDGADEALKKQLQAESVSYKVQDIVLDGAMRLLLQPRDVAFQIAPAARDVRLTLDLQNQSSWAVIALATHYCGFDFLIQEGKVVIDTREEIERRLAAGR